MATAGWPRCAAGLARGDGLSGAAELRFAGGEIVGVSADPGRGVRLYAAALAEFVVEGIKTTIPLHRELFNNSAFIEGHVDTTFIERTYQKG